MQKEIKPAKYQAGSFLFILNAATIEIAFNTIKTIPSSLDHPAKIHVRISIIRTTIFADFEKLTFRQNNVKGSNHKSIKNQPHR